MLEEDRQELAGKIRDYALKVKFPKELPEGRYNLYLKDKQTYMECQGIIMAVLGHIVVLEKLGYVVIKNDKRALKNQIKAVMGMPLSKN